MAFNLPAMGIVTATTDIVTGNFLAKGGPRVRAKTFYKRVALVCLQPPAPIWQEVFRQNRFAVRPISYDGHYWIENTFRHGAIQSKVCREGFPNDRLNDPASEDPNLPVQLTTQGLHAIEFKVHNRMSPTVAGRVWSGVMAILMLFAAYWLIGSLDWKIQGPIWVALIVYLKIVLKGGIGNVGVAKQVSGVTIPWIVTPYQLIRHIEGKKEVANASGWSE